MSLFEHLGELRSRLLKCSIAVLVLGGVSLIYARPLFEFLMKPVLRALPADAPSLVYTSAIENINVLLKVGLYAGIFFTTPIILWQIWGFVAPGLYPSERRYAYPFIIAGSIAFGIGTTFCYVMVLPTMLQFL
ncbi:MAG: twin-arginine translocase subunit TatC, partial [Myxococcaceae bacterium]